MWPFTSAYPECKARTVHEKTYDYVVVGGGTTGCIIASRLSEDPSVSVLLVCKGRVSDSYLYSIPLVGQAVNEQPFQSDVVWSRPLPHCGDGNGGDGKPGPGLRTRIPVCRALGGATRINGLMLTRDPPAVFENWAGMGNDRWKWDEVEPYMRKFETAHANPHASWRGHDGPLHIRKFEPNFIADKYYPDAASKVGLPYETELNNPDGPVDALFNIDIMISPAGFRWSVNQGYLPRSEAQARQSRLTVCTGATATRLQISADREDVVDGVHIMDPRERTPKEYYVRARREVILCCGSLFTPQLLMLSGIGPEDHLESHKIPVAKPLSGVGANLQDHVAVGLVYEVLAHDTLMKIASPFLAIWHLLQFLLWKVGLFSTMSTKRAMWLRSSLVNPDTQTFLAPSEKRRATRSSAAQTIPDVELLMVPASFELKNVRGRGYHSLACILAQPFSRGSISLASTDPLALPVLDYPALTDARDFLTIRKAVRFGMHFVEAFSKTDYPFSVKWDSAPGVEMGADTADSWREPTDEQIDAFARRLIRPIWHPTSTCRMAREEEGGVVGQDLRVHGFRNLRVGDASIFPKISSSHPMATVLMVAERCADFVKEDWKKSL